MKKLINLIALVMLVSVNVLAPFSYAQDALPEVNPENEVKTVEESLGEAGETFEVNEETPDLDPEEKGGIEQEKQEDETAEKVLSDTQDDIETSVTDDTEEVDTESDGVAQPVEEISENEIQDEEGKIEELEKVREAVVMAVIPDTTVTLLPGQEFNSVIKTLANGGTYVAYTGVDNNIQSFQRVDVEPVGVTTGEISIAGSEYPVYAWFDEGTLYYATKAETIQLNEDSQNMFQSFGALTELDLSNFDTSNVTNMYQMFIGCSSLKELDLSSFDTSNVTNMEGMFAGCSSLTGLNLSNFDTSSVTSMGNIFNGCSKIEELNLSGWNFTKVTNMSPYGPIQSASQAKKLNMENTKFSGSMNGVFSNLANLEEINLSGADVSSVTNMSYVFNGCRNLKEINLQGWDTSNVTTMNSMFYYCNSLKELDLSSFDTNRVTDMTYLVGVCSSLEKLNLDNWSFYGNPTISNMFYGTSSLKTLSAKNRIIPENFTQVLGCNGTQLCANDLVIDVSNWNLSKAKNLGGLFKSFYGKEVKGLYTWDTSGVENMGSMFDNCGNLNGLNLSGRDTSGVTNMQYMFHGCSSLTGLDLSSFDTSNVVNMQKIFNGCNKLEELNLSGWDFRNITDMSSKSYGPFSARSLKKINLMNAKFSGSVFGIFNDLHELEEVNLSGADVTRVTNMAHMFNGCRNLKEINLQGWDTSNVTTMNSMFYYCNSLKELDLSSFDTNRVTDMTYLVGVCSSLEKLNLSGWDFRNISNTSLMMNITAGGIPSLTKLNMTNTKYTGNASYAFGGLTNLEELKLDGADTRGVTNMYTMFQGCSSLTGLDLSSFDTSNVTDMQSMFNWCSKLENLDLDNWDLGKNPNMGGFIVNTPSLKSISMSGWKISENFQDKIGRNRGYPNNTIEEIDVTNWDLNKTKNLQGLFGDTKALKTIKGLNTWDTSGVTNMYSLFYNCNNLTRLDLSNWDTSNVNNMNTMFYGCSSLTGLDLSNWDTSNVINMGYMFQYCGGLQELDLSSWDTSNVTDMTSMFSSCSNLENLNLDNWSFRKSGVGSYLLQNTPNLKNLSMSGCKIPQLFTNVMGRNWGYPNNSIEKIDVSNWDLSLTKDINGLFGNMKALKEVKGLDTWNTSNINNMMNVFGNCSSLTGLDLSNWCTSNVTNMGGMFYQCSALNELDLSNFDTSKVTTIGQMFYNTPNLKTIYASENFVTTALSGDNSSKDMFSGTTSVVGGNGTKFDPNYIDEEYAKIDKVGQTGYFTDKNAINVKFINTLDGIETISTFKKGQKLTPPPVNGYHAVGGYLDEAMTQAIDLNKGVNVYSEIYVKYERNGSSGGGGGGGGGSTKPDTSKEEQKPAESPQSDASSGTNVKEPESNTGNKAEIQTGSQQPLSPTDSFPDREQTVTPLIGGDGEARGGGTQSYSPEFQQAYKFAHENGITTKDTIQSAQMNGKLTRIAMAKMLSQYAINVLGQTPDTSKTVKFKDVTSKKDADYDNGVTLAYQLGIMGQNMPGNNFRPNDEVSRAEFATALSRLLYQTTDGKYKSTKEYYIPHMAKLYNEGIISNTDPSMSERRGYVMIMLMRSAE